MAHIPRHLIVSSNQLTWKFDRPVIFLGQWCCLYQDREIWGCMDGMLAKPYGLDQNEKEKNHAESRRLEEAILPVLIKVLNGHHKVSYDSRCWQIILGHWLRQFIELMLNRVKTLQQCFKTYPINGVTLSIMPNFQLAPKNSLDSIFLSNKDEWNNHLTKRILDLMDGINCPIELIYINKTLQKKENPATWKNLGKKIIKDWFRSLVNSVATYLSENNSYFVFNTYLPKYLELKLQLHLKQVPIIPMSVEFGTATVSSKALREELTFEFLKCFNHDCEVTRIIGSMIFELLPICYLEAFSELIKLVDQQPWPKSPRLIFTSNSFHTDEIFKIYTARNVQMGTSYLVGQHGNNYGTSRYLNPSIQEVTADKYLTWGWTDGLAQHTPAFNLRAPKIKYKTKSGNQGLLLIMKAPEHRITTWDCSAEYGEYLVQQFKFIECLPDRVKMSLTIRLHAAHSLQEWDEGKRFHHLNPKIQIDYGNLPIERLISKSKLVVHAYDSTGLLQTLAGNVPSIGFWQGGVNHLRESAVPYYQLLAESGVLQFTPESAANLISECWDDVNGWWHQERIQFARKKFCERYSLQVEKPLNILVKILNEN